jgi:hypothetical protein
MVQIVFVLPHPFTNKLTVIQYCPKYQLRKLQIIIMIIIIIILAKEQYINRHDRVGAQLHFNICKETGVQLDTKHWCEQVPKVVEISRGGKVTNHTVEPTNTNQQDHPQ